MVKHDGQADAALLRGFGSSYGDLRLGHIRALAVLVTRRSSSLPRRWARFFLSLGQKGISLRSRLRGVGQTVRVPAGKNSLVPKTEIRVIGPLSNTYNWNYIA